LPNGLSPFGSGGVPVLFAINFFQKYKKTAI
jgi:hypothetical protein